MVIVTIQCMNLGLLLIRMCEALKHGRNLLRQIACDYLSKLNMKILPAIAVVAK